MSNQMKPPVSGPKTSGPKTSGKATASLVLGLVSIVGMCFTGIIGLVLGIMALGDISKSRGRVGGKGVAVTGIVLSSLGIFWTLIAFVMIGMLIPAVHQVREAARRVTSMNNMRQQSLAMLNYESAYQAFPKSDKNGLSWRVHILPYLDESRLYEQFNLDEPWDSPNNIALLDQMPAVFECPSVTLDPGMTVYKVPLSRVNQTSPNDDNSWTSLFDDSDRDLRFGAITDGSSNTINLMEVDSVEAVEWTRPSDWEYDRSNPMRNLGNIHPGVILIGFADASVQAIPNDISPEDFKALITRSGGENVNKDHY